MSKKEKDAQGLSKLDKALIEAARKGRAGALAKRLAEGADPSARDDWGCTALMWAASEGRVKALKILMPISDCRASDRKGFTALMKSAGLDNPECLMNLLPNSNLEAKCHKGKTALTEAAMMGAARAMDALLAAGANPRHVEDSGMTPLMQAARAGHLAIVKRLAPISDARARDADGWNAMMWAARWGRLDCVEHLSAWLDLMEKSDRGESALDVAKNCGHVSIMALGERAVLERSIGSAGTPCAEPKRL